MFMKFGHLVGILYYGNGKMAKKRVFVNFDPNNRISEKIDPTYPVENFTGILEKKSIFPKIEYFWSYDVIKTPFLAIFVIFRV